MYNLNSHHQCYTPWLYYSTGPGSLGKILTSKSCGSEPNPPTVRVYSTRDNTMRSASFFSCAVKYIDIYAEHCGDLFQGCFARFGLI